MGSAELAMGMRGHAEPLYRIALEIELDQHGRFVAHHPVPRGIRTPVTAVKGRCPRPG